MIVFYGSEVSLLYWVNQHRWPNSFIYYGTRRVDPVLLGSIPAVVTLGVGHARNSPNQKKTFVVGKIYSYFCQNNVLYLFNLFWCDLLKRFFLFINVMTSVGWYSHTTVRSWLRAWVMILNLIISVFTNWRRKEFIYMNLSKKKMWINRGNKS